MPLNILSKYQGLKNFLLVPLPRPQNNWRTILWLLLFSLSCSAFIRIFKPFKIENPTGEWYLELILWSLGLVFFISVYLIEFLFPLLVPQPFKRWTIGKGVLWYTLVILFVGAMMFLYKSYLGGFRDFTLQEYLYVIGRVVGISVIVVFFVLGMFSYVNRRQLSLVSAQESHLLTAPNAKPIRLNLSEILFIVSDDNYVDIHLEVDGKRKKEIFRSSLKNVETQLVHQLSPILRCHRQYLVNVQHFKVHTRNSRKMLIRLKSYEEEIPVSKKYATQIDQALQTRP